MDITTALRRGLPAVVLVAAGLSLTACGPDDSGSTASPSHSTGAVAAPTVSDTPGAGDDTASAAPSATDTAGGGSGSGGAGTSSPGSAGGGVATCTGEHLRVATSEPQPGAGSLTFQIVFTNTGSKPCSLSGYPGVSFTGGSGAQLGNAATRTSAKAPVVTLIPNAHAVAEAKTSDGPGGYSAAACHLTQAASLRVYPPNRKESLRTPWDRKVCAGSSVHALQVGPVHPVS